VARVLQAKHRPVDNRQLRTQCAGAALTPEEQSLLFCDQVRLWVPLEERDQLLGILLLGPKQGDDLYNGEDFQILEVVRRQVSITIHNIALLSELRDRTIELEQLHGQLLRAREEERKRLARELHDDIIQALVGLNYELSRYLAPEQSRAEEGRPLQQQVHQLIANLRKVCSDLRPPALDSLGLVSAVRSRLRDLESEGTLHIKLVLDGDEEAGLPEEVEICLYRVLQEALINIQKHAQASQVVVCLVIHSTEIVLSVQDNGRGFLPPPQLSQLIHEGHFGLAGVRERLELVGGKLSLNSVIGQGTCLETRVPLSLSTTSDLSGESER